MLRFRCPSRRYYKATYRQFTSKRLLRSCRGKYANCDKFVRFTAVISALIERQFILQCTRRLKWTAADPEQTERDGILLRKVSHRSGIDMKPQIK